MSPQELGSVTRTSIGPTPSLENTSSEQVSAIPTTVTVATTNSNLEWRLREPVSNELIAFLAVSTASSD